jgi:hypothetical protein
MGLDGGARNVSPSCYHGQPHNLSVMIDNFWCAPSKGGVFPVGERPTRLSAPSVGEYNQIQDLITDIECLDAGITPAYHR